MISYLIAFSWGIYILFSFIGYGKIINRLFFPNQRIDWGQRAAWGLAFSIFVGGILNATWMISQNTILIYLGVGFVYGLVDFINNRKIIISSGSKLFQKCRQDRLVLAGVVLVGLLILLQYGGWIDTVKLDFSPKGFAPGFNTDDDYHAYLVFPHKMLQLGSMGADPFSERRITSLGGQSFLHTLILAALSDINLNIIDPGIALLIMTGLILGYCQYHQVSARRTLFLLLFMLFITPPKVNTTSIILQVVLMISIFRAIESTEIRNSHFTRNAFIIALITAANCALKSSLIPFSLIFLCLIYSCYFFSSRTKIKVASEFILTIVLVGLFLMPWMISSYQSSGTLLFPLLGKGYAYGITSQAKGWDAVKKAIDFLLDRAIDHLEQLEMFIVAVLGLSLSIRPFKPDGSSLIVRQVSISITISAIVATYAIGIATEDSDTFRYAFSHLFAAILILVMIAISDKEKVNKNAIINFFNIAVVSVFLEMGFNWYSTQNIYYGYLRRIQFRLSNSFLFSEQQMSKYPGIQQSPKESTALTRTNFPFLFDFKRKQIFRANWPLLFSEQQISKYTAMQQSIPKGSTVLTRLAFPFLLDFKRNQIFIADWPGRTSLPPGMPLFQGSEALANYLVSKSIRYIAYSATSLNYPELDISNPGVNSLIREQAKLANDFRDSVKQLANTRKRIYEDGENFVLDLQSQAN